MKRRPLIYRSIWIYYFKYKDTVIFTVSVFSLIILISVFLFWKVILPQVQSWFSIQNEVAATRERIKNIQDNIALLSNLNSAELDQYFATSVAAFPPDKDYFGILSAVSSSAIETNVSLEDYSFEVGALKSESSEDSIPVKLSIQLNNEIAQEI